MKIAHLLVAGALAFSTASLCAQSTVYVTPTNMQGWSNNDTTVGSVSAITPVFPRSGNGSAQLTTTPTGKSSFELYWNPIGTNPFGTNTTIASLSTLSMDIFRSSATDSLPSAAPDYAAPALRFFFNDGQGHAGSLVYEFVYNGSGSGTPVVPNDTWLNVDYLSSKLWMNTGGTNYDVAGGFLTLQQWTDPSVAKIAGTYTLDPNTTYVTGVQFSYGSSAGAFEGAVDNVRVGFAGGNDNLYNFEVVPEPSTFALGFLGLAGLAASWRLRRSRRA
ncbi:MAG: PEP-CTERM sorting domain-containing protein [Chthoniobacterales bacterium]